jgi:hypothetical protein
MPTIPSSHHQDFNVERGKQIIINLDDEEDEYDEVAALEVPSLDNSST